MRQNDVRFLLLTSIMLCLTGCAFHNLNSRQNDEKNVNHIALQNNFKKALIKTSSFTLTSFQKFTQPHASVTIYIEGDGRTWITRTKLSANPTPRNPLALKLAVLDKSPNVAYLARPCQYTALALEPICHNPAIWSDLRFSKMVIHSMNEAVEKIKKAANANQIHLVGYSGGAAIAVLIAANRSDIATLRTVAGDLNHAALSHYHQTTPLQGSLNPMDFASKLTKLPQHHFSGEKDTVAPSFIAKAFVDEVIKQGGHNASSAVIKGASHHQGWEKAWPDLLNAF